MRRFISIFILSAFVSTTVVPPSYAQNIPATNLGGLPIPGSVVSLTPAFTPAMVKGINIYPDNPLKFDFIIDQGETALKDEEFKAESTKLIKYFLASLTVPEEEMWVNLSPYEKDRIIPEHFAQTEMGRDLLAQDYLLKQLTASLMNPEDTLGKTFWDKVYKQAQEKFNTTDIPMNTFNKIWIVPEQAKIYEHKKGAFIVDTHLKVMMEEDYVALNHSVIASEAKQSQEIASSATRPRNDTIGIQSQVVKEILLPAIEKEVNEGETFAQLRQVYYSFILASWYKKALKESLLGQLYADQNKTQGVDIEDKDSIQKIYDQYIAAFEKGVYNTIKEEYDPESQEVIQRKYFSGGAKFTGDYASLSGGDEVKKAIERAARSSKEVTWEGRSADGERIIPKLNTDLASLSGEDAHNLALEFIERSSKVAQKFQQPFYNLSGATVAMGGGIIYVIKALQGQGRDFRIRNSEGETFTLGAWMGKGEEKFDFRTISDEEFLEVVKLVINVYTGIPIFEANEEGFDKGIRHLKRKLDDPDAASLTDDVITKINGQTVYSSKAELSYPLKVVKLEPHSRIARKRLIKGQDTSFYKGKTLLGVSLGNQREPIWTFLVSEKSGFLTAGSLVVEVDFDEDERFLEMPPIVTPEGQALSDEAVGEISGVVFEHFLSALPVGTIFRGRPDSGLTMGIYLHPRNMGSSLSKIFDEIIANEYEDEFKKAGFGNFRIPDKIKHLSHIDLLDATPQLAHEFLFEATKITKSPDSASLAVEVQEEIEDMVAKTLEIDRSQIHRENSLRVLALHDQSKVRELFEEIEAITDVHVDYRHFDMLGEIYEYLGHVNPDLLSDVAKKERRGKSIEAVIDTLRSDKKIDKLTSGEIIYSNGVMGGSGLGLTVWRWNPGEEIVHPEEFDLETSEVVSRNSGYNDAYRLAKKIAEKFDLDLVIKPSLIKKGRKLSNAPEDYILSPDRFVWGESLIKGKEEQNIKALSIVLQHRAYRNDTTHTINLLSRKAKSVIKWLEREKKNLHRKAKVQSDSYIKALAQEILESRLLQEADTKYTKYAVQDEIYRIAFENGYIVTDKEGKPIGLPKELRSRKDEVAKGLQNGLTGDTFTDFASPDFRIYTVIQWDDIYNKVMKSIKSSTGRSKADFSSLAEESAAKKFEREIFVYDAGGKVKVELSYNAGTNLTTVYTYKSNRLQSVETEEGNLIPEAKMKYRDITADKEDEKGDAASLSEEEKLRRVESFVGKVIEESAVINSKIRFLKELPRESFDKIPDLDPSNIDMFWFLKYMDSHFWGSLGDFGDSNMFYYLVQQEQIQIWGDLYRILANRIPWEITEQQRRGLIASFKELQKRLKEEVQLYFQYSQHYDMEPEPSFVAGARRNIDRIKVELKLFKAQFAFYGIHPQPYIASQIEALKKVIERLENKWATAQIDGTDSETKEAIQDELNVKKNYLKDLEEQWEKDSPDFASLVEVKELQLGEDMDIPVESVEEIITISYDDFQTRYFISKRNGSFFIQFPSGEVVMTIGQLYFESDGSKQKKSILTMVRWDDFIRIRNEGIKEGVIVSYRLKESSQTKKEDSPDAALLTETYTQSELEALGLSAGTAKFLTEAEGPATDSASLSLTEKERSLLRSVRKKLLEDFIGLYGIFIEDRVLNEKIAQRAQSIFDQINKVLRLLQEEPIAYEKVSEGVLKEVRKRLESPEGPDAASLANPDEVGGIDFNANNLKMDVDRQGEGVEMPNLPQAIENIQIDGIVPFIINITPITNLPLLLGFTPDENKEAEEVSYNKDS